MSAYTAHEDATSLQGIVDLLAEGPATICEISMCGHLSDKTAVRLVKILEKAAIVEENTVVRINHKQRNRRANGYKLASGYLKGLVAFDAEKLAKTCRRGIF